MKIEKKLRYIKKICTKMCHELREIELDSGKVKGKVDKIDIKFQMQQFFNKKGQLNIQEIEILC